MGDSTVSVTYGSSSFFIGRKFSGYDVIEGIHLILFCDLM